MRRKVWSFWIRRRNIAGMLKLERSIISRLVCRFRSRAVVELENLALRHQLHVLRRQRPGRLPLFTFDRLLWVWLYLLWPRCLEVMVLVKPASVVQSAAIDVQYQAAAIDFPILCYLIPSESGNTEAGQRAAQLGLVLEHVGKRVSTFAD